AFDGVGARSRVPEDAWIYTVVYNPVNVSDAVSYKLGSPGSPRGTLSDDAYDAIVGRLGVSPPLTDVRILSTDLDSGRRTNLVSRVADESALDQPGGDALSLIAPVALLQGDALALRSSPPDQSGT